MDLNSLLPKPQGNRIWSPFQQAIFDSNGPIIIDAKAGSGKTTTLIELMKRRGGNALFMAFNKAVANEISTRVSGQTVKTTNALGHGILTRNRRGAKLDQWKVPNRLRQVMNPYDYKEYGLILARAIGLAKANAFYNPNQKDFTGIFSDYDLELPFDLEPEFALICEKVFLETLSNENSFDFDDQLYLPIREGWTFPTFDSVYIDEAQDLSPIQHLMVQQLVQKGATPVAVGDPFQAIYGFRGAMEGSMADLQNLFSMDCFPLSITYRCSRLITELAQELVPDIQWRENAPDGEINADYEPTLNEFTPGTLTLCRNNAPLFRVALEHIRQKRPCRVQSAFLERMESFINGFDASLSVDLMRKLNAWYAKESEQCSQRSNWRRLAHADDKFKTIELLAKEFKTTREILDAIRKLSTSSQGPRISTIHRAKGLEEEKVFIMAPNLLPPDLEKNLRYVAITRAKNSLNFMPEE